MGSFTPETGGRASDKQDSVEVPPLSINQTLPGRQDSFWRTNLPNTGRDLYSAGLPALDLTSSRIEPTGNNILDRALGLVPSIPAQRETPQQPATPPREVSPNPWQATPPREVSPNPWQLTPPRELTPQPPGGPDRVPGVKQDAAGYVTDINYPGSANKSRHIDWDPQTHTAKSITTTTPGGATTLANRGGNWVLQVQGLELSVGQMQIGKNGEIATLDSSSGLWKVERPDGSVSQERRGGQAIDRPIDRPIGLPDSGESVTKINGPSGTREFKYIGEGDRKSLVSVTDTRQTSNGEQKETWTRVVNIDGSLSNEFRAQGSDGRALKSRYNIKPHTDGEYEYSLATDNPGDKPHLERMSRRDSTNVAASVEEAREQLVSVLEGQMDRARLDRNTRFMKDFEQRLMDHVELKVAAGGDEQKATRDAEKCLIDTYKQCCRLAGTAESPKELYDQKTRVNLTENLLYLAAHPEDINQGKTTGTCWFEASWNVGMFQRNVDQAARFVADVALTGQYTTTAGSLNGGGPRTIKVRPEYVKIDPNVRDTGGDWTPETAKVDHRNMVGMLIDQIGPVVAGQRSWGQSRGGFHQQARDIVYMMTGKDEVRSLTDSMGRAEKLRLLQSGGYTVSGTVDPRTLQPTPGGVGHMWAYTMHKDRNGWYVLRDDQHNDDRVVQRIPDLKKWLNGTEGRLHW